MRRLLTQDAFDTEAFITQRDHQVPAAQHIQLNAVGKLTASVLNVLIVPTTCSDDERHGVAFLGAA